MRTARVNPAQGGKAFKTNSRYCAHGPKTGAASGFRTRDIELGRLAFCQLNYRRFTETAHSLFGQGWEVDLSASRFTLTTERPKRCFARHVLRRTSLTNNGQQPLARDFVVHGLSPHRHAEHNGEQQKWPHEEKARHGSHRLGLVAFGWLCAVHRLAKNLGREVFASEGGLYAVNDAGRQFVGPFVNGLICHTDGFGGSRDGAPKQINGFCFLHSIIEPQFKTACNFSSNAAGTM